MKEYAPETIGSLMATNILRVKPSTMLGEVLKELTTKNWQGIPMVYVVDESQKLLGQIDIGELAENDHDEAVKNLMQPSRHYLHPEADQETALFMAVQDDLITIPVIDRHHRLLGAVTAYAIIDIMHDEHIEDALLTSGIRKNESGMHIAKLATERTGLIVRMRIPWLIFGLFAGLGLGLIASFFEESLRDSLALAYFIPVIPYVASAVGTQSETIAIRALAVLKIEYRRYFFKEVLVGFVLGIGLGIFGGLGAFLISGSADIGWVVGLSVAVASTLAAALASLIPIIFKVLGKDPALGSGPLATAIQDIISVLIYFFFAVLFIH